MGWKEATDLNVGGQQNNPVSIVIASYASVSPRRSGMEGYQIAAQC
jgi:hypothetical protein